MKEHKYRAFELQSLGLFPSLSLMKIRIRENLDLQKSLSKSFRCISELRVEVIQVWRDCYMQSENCEFYQMAPATILVLYWYFILQVSVNPCQSFYKSNETSTKASPENLKYNSALLTW